MQDEIMQQEESAQRMRNYEQEAWNEIMEEKKAENRAKTVHLTSALERHKEVVEVPQEVDELALIQ